MVSHKAHSHSHYFLAQYGYAIYDQKRRFGRLAEDQTRCTARANQFERAGAGWLRELQFTESDKYI